MSHDVLSRQSAFYVEGGGDFEAWSRPSAFYVERGMSGNTYLPEDVLLTELSLTILTELGEEIGVGGGFGPGLLFLVRPQPTNFVVEG